MHKMVNLKDFSDRPLTDASPFEKEVVLERRFLPDSSGGLENHVLYTNVPHLVVWHSPAGYEWGYGGSGPADLALNILENALRRMDYKGDRSNQYRGSCFNIAVRLHQLFKQDFLVSMERDGGTIAYEKIVEWIDFHRDDE